MRTGKAMHVLRISCPALDRWRKDGKLKAPMLSLGRYEFDDNDVYSLLAQGASRETFVYGRVSTRKQKNALTHLLVMLKQCDLIPENTPSHLNVCWLAERLQDHQALPTKTSQEILKESVGRDWPTFFRSTKEYIEYSGKFFREPQKKYLLAIGRNDGQKPKNPMQRKGKQHIATILFNQRIVKIQHQKDELALSEIFATLVKKVVAA